MKSILIIGMGRFGHHLCKNLIEQNNEIMIVDKLESAVEDMMPLVTSALVADCTKEDVLSHIGVSDFDICFVCIGSDFQSNLEITCLLKELGAGYVVSMSKRVIHTKFLLRNGADEVIHPDKDIAERVAIKYSNDHIFDYIELRNDYSIFEISPLKEWIGHSLKDSDIRARYNISIIAVKDENSEMNVTLHADYVIKPNDHLMIISRKKDIDNVIKKLQ